MLTEWMRKREKKKIQRLCPHEYHNLTVERRENFFKIYSVQNMYCPNCDSEITISHEESNRILARQKIRNRYELID